MTPLRQRMLEDMSIRHLTDNTKLSYIQPYFPQVTERI